MKEKLVAEVLRSISSNLEETLSAASASLSAWPLHQCQGLGEHRQMEFKIHDFGQNADEILDVVERIVVAKKFWRVVC